MGRPWEGLRVNLWRSQLRPPPSQVCGAAGGGVRLSRARSIPIDAGLLALILECIYIHSTVQRPQCRKPT